MIGFHFLNKARILSIFQRSPGCQNIACAAFFLQRRRLFLYFLRQRLFFPYRFSFFYRLSFLHRFSFLCKLRFLDRLLLLNRLHALNRFNILHEFSFNDKFLLLDRLSLLSGLSRLHKFSFLNNAFLLLCFFLGTAIEIDAHGIAERDDGRLGQARPLRRTVKLGQDALEARHHAHVEERRRNRAVAYLGEARLELPDRHVLFQQSRYSDFQAILVKHEGDAPRRRIIPLADSASKQAAHEIFRKLLQSTRLETPRQKALLHIVRCTVHLFRQGTGKLFAADEIKARRTKILGALDEAFGKKFLRRSCEQMPAARRAALALLLTQKLPCQEILLLQAHDIIISAAFLRLAVHHAAEFLDLHITDRALGRELIGAAVRARKKKLLHLIRLGEARRAADAHIGAVHHAQFLDEIRLFHTGENLHDDDLPSVLQFHTDARENARLAAVENLLRNLIYARNELRLC